MSDGEPGIKPLEIISVIGFDGTTINGLKSHPGGQEIVYPMGNKVCIQNWYTKKMSFLAGHTNIISAVAVSDNGLYIGSGQINHIGFKAATILWDYNKKASIAQHMLHKVRVEALVFSHDDSLMISIGGRDCGQIVVWDIKTNNARCTMIATKATAGDAVTVSGLMKRYNSFITAGDNNLRIWSLDAKNKTSSVVDVTMGKIRRYILCITISHDDSIAYCGTTSGDIVKISIGYPSDSCDTTNCKPSMIGCFAKCGEWNKNTKRPDNICYSSGARCIILLDKEHLIVGAGDGTIDLLEEIKWKSAFPKDRLCSPVSPDFKVLKTIKISGCVTSLQLMDIENRKKKETVLLVGTRTSEIYSVNLKTFEPTLMITCHANSVNDVTFPLGMSDVFATAGYGDVRVWNLKTCQELLRIKVPNFICTSILFSGNGKSIVTAWNDGCLRAFTPLTGKLIYCIYNAHNKGASAIALTEDGHTLISGGCEGQVRVWGIEPHTQYLKAVLKEHKCPVSAIKVNTYNTEAVSAGTDGSCIIWDIINLCRRQILFANTVFMCICYDPTGCQILTGGSDRRVAYWEAGSGNLARELEASRTDAVNALHINATGDLFATGGNDQLVKLWKYHDGIYKHIGVGHSGVVNCISFSPNGKYIVSGSASGSIIIWKCPEEYLEPSRKSSAQIEGSLKTASRQNSGIKMKETAHSSTASDKIPHSVRPVKDENISTMDTARSSVIASCPCSCRTKSATSNPEESSKKNTGSSSAKSVPCSCTCKKLSKPPVPIKCNPPVSEINDD